MLPTLQRVAGAANVVIKAPVTGAEDFSLPEKVLGLFVFLGVYQKAATRLPPHHTADFYIDESGFAPGVKALCNLTLDYMGNKSK